MELALRPGRATALIFVLALLAAAAPGAAARAWSPGPARYGVTQQKDVPVTMADGTVLRADVYVPTDPRTGKPARGPFPVVLVQTPYGREAGGASAATRTRAEAGLEAGAVPYLVQRGYIDVVAAVRGTGDSGGSWGLLDPIQQQDGATLVRWAARLPHSSGKVGLYGPSYMGIDQFMTVQALGPRSPIKALFPIVAANDLYRDAAFMGGLPAMEFDAAYLGLTGALNTFEPVVESGQDPGRTAGTEIAHAGGLFSFHISTALDILTGGNAAYDQDFWRARSPRGMLAAVVRSHTPAFLLGGWFDLFQRGQPMNYAGLQNLLAGRSPDAPMDPRRRPSARYQLMMGPWYHVTAGDGVDVYRLELQWFDRWLKGRRTGIDRTRTPLHVYDITTGRWADTTRYPFAGARPTRLFLAGGGALTPRRPAPAQKGADSLTFTGVSNPCGRQAEQWGAGGTTLALLILRQPAQPCTRDDSPQQTGPGALTYTTPPFARSRVVAGPVGVTVYATSTRPDVELEATLEDVGPDRRSQPLTSGALLGSFRALDRRRSWTAPGGGYLQPFHPYTRASVRAVKVGAVTRYDIEVFPTVATIAAGHRLRLTLLSSDVPHVIPTSEQLQRLLGGRYEILRGGRAASEATVPLAPPAAFARRCAVCRAPAS